MAHIINSHDWVLPTDVIEYASRKASEQKRQFVYLSADAQKGDDSFLFFADEERKVPVFVIDAEPVY